MGFSDSRGYAARHQRTMGCLPHVGLGLLSVDGQIAAELRRSTTIGEIRGPCRLEPMPMRMVANDATTKTYRILASFWVFHQAFGEIESLPEIFSDQEDAFDC